MRSPRRSVSGFGWVFLSVVVTLNLCALGVAWRDRSFGAAAIAMFYGPAGNGLLALLALAASLALQRRPGFSMARHLALSLGAPAVAIVADFLLILSMGLHGC